MTFLQRIAPDNIRKSLSSLPTAAVRHRRSLRLTATAILAVAAVVTPLAAQAAYAEGPTYQSSQPAKDFAARAAFDALATAKVTAEQVNGRADLTRLDSAIEALENNYSSDPAVLAKLTDAAGSAVVLAEAAAAGHDAGAPIAKAAVAKAKAAKAKAEAIARAKAAAAARAKAAAAAAAAAASSSSS